MKPILTFCLVFLISHGAYAEDSKFKLLYDSELTPLAQALVQPQIELQADPLLSDIFQPRVLLLSKGGLTDQGVAQLGANTKQHLVRLTVAAKSSASKVEDAFNGNDGTVYYLYTVLSGATSELQTLQNIATQWYSHKGQIKISSAGYTPPPLQLLKQNKVTLSLTQPQYPQGYR